MATILCVDDEPSAIEVMRHALESAGHRVVAVHNVDAAWNVLDRGTADLVLSDYLMPDTDGLDFIAQLQERGVHLPVVMVTGHGSIRHAVEAIKAGAADYVTKPIDAARLRHTVEQALDLDRLRRENEELRQEVVRLRGERTILGESVAIRATLETVAMVAPTRSTVLILGESGTGKELVARAIHEHSERADGPYITVNCAAIPETLVESALFGHEKGAFTGATRQVKGAFERAHKGTLLLDEISEMDVDLQAKLLRVLQEMEFERVGGSTPLRVDVRVLATTNRDLDRDVQAGRIRQDLYYRLRVVPIRVPPLRERVDDIPLLAHHFAARAAAHADKTFKSLTPEAVRLLQAHPWPGNVRELMHAVERAVILSRDPVLQAEDFDLLPHIPHDEHDHHTPDQPTVLLRTFDLREAEAVLIRHALRATGQNRTRAAELLGITDRTLRNKLNRPSPD